MIGYCPPFTAEFAYLLSSLCWAVGSSVARVHSFIDNQELAVDVNSSINVRFQNGVMGTVVIGGNCPVRGRHMTFAFDNGGMGVKGRNSKVKRRKSGSSARMNGPQPSTFGPSTFGSTAIG